MDLPEVKEEVVSEGLNAGPMADHEKLGSDVDSEQVTANGHLLRGGNYVYLNKVSGEQTAVDPNRPLVYLTETNSQKIVGITPVLLLSNNGQKGTMEANVMLENTQTAFVQLSGQLQAMAQASLIAQTQQHIAQQLGDGESDKTELKPNVIATCEQHGNKDAREVTDEKDKNKDPGECTKVYMCEKEGCGKMFVYAGSRKFHQASQGHFASPKAFECPYTDCGRKFSRPAHFKYHQLTHTNNRQFVCEVDGCNNRFFTAQRLRVHMRKHTGEKPFLCGDCGKSFSTAGNLKNHERIHTGERPFACDHEGCTKRFSESSSLKKHKLVHTGEKPFSCNICCKSFSQSGSRMVHMKRHEMSSSTTVRCKRGIDEKTDLPTKREKFLPQRVTIVSLGKTASHFQENQGDNSGVLSQDLNDIGVTVTSHSAESAACDITSDVLGTRALDGDVIHSDTSNKAVSVVVLSQPQEIVGLSSPYHQSHISGREEIIYETDLLHTDLDHEEIAHSEFSLQSLTQGPQGAGDMSVGESIMVSDRGLTEHGDISSSTQTGREMALDPMMESDDEIDHLEESKDLKE